MFYRRSRSHEWWGEHLGKDPVEGSEGRPSVARPTTQTDGQTFEGPWVGVGSLIPRILLRTWTALVAPESPVVETVDTVDTVNTVNTVDTVNTVNTVILDGE